jgi:hypothetical protein
LIPLGLAVEVALILLIVYAPVGNLLFGTAPLGPGPWLVAAPFALLLLAGDRAREALVPWALWRRGAPGRPRASRAA